MKSHLKSEGKYYPGSKPQFLTIVCLVFISIIGCQTGEKSRISEPNPAEIAKSLSEEVSLKEDREKFEQLRIEVPKATQEANDELAMDLELMAKAQRPPAEIRSQFQQKVRDLRSRFREKAQDVRAEFRDTQAKQRSDFLKSLEKERSEFKEQKPDREKSKEFFASQDLKRRDFFSLQKDQRKEFESEVDAKTKAFNANMKLRIQQFEEQLRLYSKKHAEQKRSEALGQNKSSTSSPARFKSNAEVDAEAAKILKEFDDMKTVPAEKLGP